MKTRLSPGWPLAMLAVLLLCVGPLGAANMSPISLSGFNRDLVVENTAVGPPFSSCATNLNPGEGNAFYQAGLPGKTYGLPSTGSFTSAMGDGTTFQFQSYTANNALVLSTDTGLTSGTLTLAAPAIYKRIAVLANSGSANAGSSGTLTLTFLDGTTLAASYYAPDWFNNTNFALQGTERINITSGALSGAPTNPRFYQTTIDIDAALGSNNKPLASLTFGQASGAKSTGIYAVSGETGAQTATSITAQPSDANVFELDPVSFSAAAGGWPLPTFQWYRNGTPIAGATRSTYTITAAPRTDNGAGFRLVASNFVNNVSCLATSRTALLTVRADTNPPVLLSAASYGLNQVWVSFSKRLLPSSVTNTSNYAISGTNGPVSVLSAAQDSSQSNVLLGVTTLLDKATYTLSVSNLLDQTAAANRLAPSQASFVATPLASVSIGSPEPAGTQVVTADGWNISASGADLGGTNDQCRFSWVQRTGDFDVKVRLDSLSLADAWSEAGVVAREDLTPGARSAAAVATPSISGCYFQSRSAVNGATALAGSFPVNYPNTWLRLSRVGNTFTGFASLDGQNWKQLGSALLALPGTVYLGFAVSSHQPGQLATGAFREFSDVTNAASISGLPFEPLGQCSRRTSLVISEIMYHPTNAVLEFVEIFNSRGEPQDVSGYQLGGDISYTFPAGTVLPGGGFVVIARSPTDLQSAYGLSSVLGPYTNNLPNEGGTVRLLTQSGGIVLEVQYSDNAPWPVAADGAGHSLVLAHPSYGENNPLAWAASDSVGGSPGRLDPYTPGPLRNVMINEFLAHTDPPDLDYIELYNHSAAPVDISGCILTDDASTNKFTIPPGTTLPPNGFISFNEVTLGFALEAAGETIYLKDPTQRRVLDAIRFEGQENGIATGRYPDGAPEWYRLASKTPGTNNAAFLVDDIVINELMYHPASGNDDEQYVELFNRGASPVNLGGWTLADGISFTFPSNTVIAPNGYLVVGRSAARLLTNYPALNPGNTLGDFGGKLAGSGERVALTKPDTVVSTNRSGVVSTNLIHIIVDEVTYGTGGRWPQWADGGGSSLELIDPRANHRLASNWTDSDETRKAPWTQFSATGTIDNGNVAADQLQVLLQGAGECLVDNVQVLTGGTNLIANSTFETDATGWTAEGTESHSGLESTEGYLSARSYHLRTVDRGDNQVNRVRTPLTSALASGTTNVTIRAMARWLKGSPGLTLRLRGNWLECAGEMTLPSTPGTPGARNSRFAANTGPAIWEVQHSPTLPAANEGIKVTARMHDPDGLGMLTLRYRLDPDTVYTSLPMTDNGAGTDAVSGDGVFTATIPGQAAGTMVAFYIQAADLFSPAASALFPNDASARECLVRVGELQPTGNFPVYRIWMTQATLNTWTSRNKLDNSPFDVTFVLGGDRVIYNAQGTYAGSPYIAPSYTGPTSGRCGYTVTVPGDDLFLGETDIVLDWPGGHGNETTALQEQMGYWVADRLNLPFSHRYTIRLHVNGVTDTARKVVFEAAQQPAKGFLKEWRAGDSDGQFFKIERAFEFNDAGARVADPQPTLEKFTTTGGAKKLETYRWTWVYRGTTRANDYTNIFSLVDAVNATAPEPYTSATLGLVDMEEWMRIFATEHIIANFDSYGHAIGKNMYGYLPQKGKWQLYMFDLDWLMLAAQNYGYYANTAPLFNADDTAITRMYAHPPFVRAYWRAVQDAINGPLVAANYGPVMDAKYKSLVANGVAWCDYQALTDPTAVKTWFSQRQAFLQSQLAAVMPAFTVNSTAIVTNGTALISGTAPVTAKEIAINGSTWSVTWTTVNNWTATVPLKTGLNTFTVTGIDSQGQQVPGATGSVNVSYPGTVPSPVGAVTLNEILYAPQLPGGGFVELFNASTNYSFDLSGWQVNGLGYTFPNGAFLNPLSYLVLAKDRTAFDTVYGPELTVLDTFNGNLQVDGETLSLIKPGTAPEADLVVDRVRYEPAAPWPAPAPGASLQMVDPSRDHGRVGNWAVGSTSPPRPAQWVYVWTNLTATSSRLYVYLTNSAGDLYLDDMKLVAGAIPEAGADLLQNGNFESALSPSWSLAGNFVSSALSTTIKHLGNSSLHLVASAGGSGAGNSVYQDISPALINGATYTLSFWYLQSTNTVVPPLVLRLSGATTMPLFDPAAPLPAPTAPSTPGSTNSVARNFPAFPAVWLNELQAQNLTGPSDNYGERDPWVELYNPGTNAVSLAGLYLGTNYASPTLWAFPPNVSIGPGQFLVVWCDGQPQQNTPSALHTPFRLSPGSGTLALSRFVSNTLEIVDYLSYSGLQANYSYGDVPDAQPFYRQSMYRATPAGTNNAALPPINVRINEWMAENTGFMLDAATGNYDDWFELYNLGDTPAELAGYYLTDNLTNQFQYQIPSGYRVPAHGFLLVWADGKTSANSTNAPELHLPFKLNKDGEAIGLFAPDGSTIDAVSFTTQSANVSEGRFPDGGTLRLFMLTPSPAAPNVLPPAPGRPVVSQTSLSPGGPVTLTFSTSPGHSYRVDFKNDLNASYWSALTGPVFATEAQMSVSDPGPLPTQRFYRIVQLD